jgi:hypothetical protein
MSTSKLVTSVHMATTKPKAQVVTRRVLNTYGELWLGSEYLHRRATDERKGAYWAAMASAILAAFTFEAYLNHVGPKIFKQWQERRSHKRKLDMVCEKLGLSFPHGERPGQSIKALFRFRNALAHGKSEVFEPKPRIEVAERFEEQSESRRPQAMWEKFCSDAENVRCVREDVSIMIRAIHEAANPKDDPVFSSGFTSHHATLWEPDRTKKSRRKIPRG